MAKKRDTIDTPYTQIAADFIRISKSLKEKLLHLKVHPRESYSEVIYRLLVVYEERKKSRRRIS